MKNRILILIVSLLALAGKVTGQCELTSDTDTDNQTVCINSPIKSITYTNVDATGGSVTTGALPAGLTVSFTAPILTISGTPTASGSFDYTATLTGEDECSSSGTITVNPLPAITGTLSVCAGSITTLIGSGIPDATVPWSSASTGIATVTSGGVVTGLSAGTSIITYKDNNGCTNTATVTVKAIPVPIITGPAPVCITATGIIFYTEPGKTSYSWSVSAGGSITGGSGTNSISTNWGATGAQTVSVSYTSDGCPAAAPVNYSVNVVAKPSPSNVQISGSLKKGKTINTTYTYVPGVCFAEDLSKTEIRWYRNTVASGTGSMITMKYANDKTYTLVNADRNMYIRTGIRLSDGSSLRDEVFSPWEGPVGDNAPEATNVSIVGNVRSGLTVYGTYNYVDAENDPEGISILKWYSANNAAGTDTKTEISTGQSYIIDYALINKYIGFEVTPLATHGTSPGPSVITIPFAGPVLNSAPVATSVSIAGILRTGQVLNGLYTYNDAEGDIESGSIYKWFSSTTSGGTFIATGETGRSRIITLSDQGKYFKFSVVPKAATGTQNSIEYLSIESGRINSQPVVTGVSISGTVEVGQTLTGNFTVSDPDGDGPLTASIKWLRTGGMPITGAINNTYDLTADDEGFNITFEVTPHSTGGFPTTGDAVSSAATITVPISPSTPKPVASDVCIQGVRAAGQTLTGRYTYTFTKPEGASEYKWKLGGLAIAGAINNTYMLTAGDVSSNQDLTFEVTPKSTPPVKAGTTIPSAAMARIILSQVTYPETVESVVLNATPAGGIFSGPNVTQSIFSPKDAGIGGPFTVNYNYIISNTSNTCSQQESKDLTVIAAETKFGSVKSVYCRDDAPDLITVDNLPAGAEPYPIEPYYGFWINTPESNPAAIVSGTEILTPNPYSGTTPWSVKINPALLNVGNNTLNLYYYDDMGNLYLLTATLFVEEVGTITEISNLSTAYCAADPQQNIQVYGLYPAGGTASWTGNILTDETQLVAKVNPGMGTPGETYPVSYQYITANGCKSNILSKNVTINPMPDASFNLNPSYNVNGDPFVMVASIPSGGIFLGDGISGNTLFPDIAGTGLKNIVFKITDINGCIDEITKSTVIRKARGTINGLADVECYRNSTVNISVTGLPDDPLDVINILNFKNKKNSIVWTPGSVTAQYDIAAARAGYDTLTFSYTWDGVPYSISHGVYIDSIGKILITGLNDNYCDYAETATLRVLVENSAGSGNFAFSGSAAAFKNYGLLADFYPSQAPPSATPYTVSYTHVSAVNNSGCIKTETLPVTVNKSPDISIFNSRVTVNIIEDPLILSGSPAEGLFSGKGVYKKTDDYVFNPSVAGLGDIEIVFLYTDIKGCTASKTDTLVVSEARGSISGINPNNQYCYDGLKDTLTYTSSELWNNGSFSGAGVTDIGSAKAVFSPSVAGKGDHDIVFTYYDDYGTLFDVSARVNVDSLGVVEIKPIAAGDEYCENITPVELITSPRGGSFTGPVTTGYFTPSKALGDTAITYTYLNIRTGCSITGRVSFKVHSAPVVTFLPEDLCIKNKFDSISFINNTTSVDAVTTWLWSFSDIGGTDYSSKQTPAYLFRSGGQHLITLTATTVNNCAVKKDLTYDLGVKPVADFFWKNECFVAGDSVLLFDNTEWTSAIVSRSWDFFDGASLKTGTELKYPKNAVGIIPVRYIVRTAYEGCSDTVTKNIYIRPNIIISSDGYFEDFELGDGGWSPGDESLNSWSFGTPDRSKIKSAASGSTAWFTRFDSVQIESSSVNSPCFDFSNIERPMIRLSLMKNFNKDRDGAALQYRIGEMGSWQYIGSVGDGINWYNSTFIKGRPGGDQMGWTSDVPDLRWLEAQHTLDELKGKKDIKLRIAYGSDGNAQDNDGLAFDDIFIGERKRNVLLEHFTNNSSLRSSEATGMINSADTANDNDFVNIQYHTNFPGIDSFYVDNPGDASARILFYGLTKAPYAFIDGGTRNNYAEKFDFSSVNPDGSLAQINTNDIIRRGLISPVFDIRLDSLVVSGGVLTVSGGIRALETDTLSNLTLYLAVIEKTNTKYTGAAGETLFRNVFRKFIPDAAGISLPSVWSKGVNVPIQDQTWIIQKTLNLSDIEVVAFIQNNVTKEVYQAASMLKPKISVSIEKPGIMNNISFALYPNPAKHKLTLRFGEPPGKDLDIFIYDFGGMIVKTFKAGSGNIEFIIDDLGLKDGIYLIRVSSGAVNFGFKKLIITGS